MTKARMIWCVHTPTMHLSEYTYNIKTQECLININKLLLFSDQKYKTLGSQNSPS